MRAVPHCAQAEARVTAVFTVPMAPFHARQSRSTVKTAMVAVVVGKEPSQLHPPLHSEAQKMKCI